MRCPLPRYYFCHAVVASGIAVVVWPIFGITSGVAAGIAFYVGREFTQWEQGNGPGLPFDWPGIIAPTVVCLLLLEIYNLLT